MSDPTPSRAPPSTAPAEVGLFFATVPVLGVKPGHVAEARRALKAQGRIVDDPVAERLLWLARALPPALDLLGDARSAVSLRDVVFCDALVEPRAAAASTDHAPLIAVAHCDSPGEATVPASGSPDALDVVVQFFERRALQANESDLVPCHCTVHFFVTAGAAPAKPVDGAGDSTVPLLRFTHGRTG